MLGLWWGEIQLTRRSGILGVQINKERAQGMSIVFFR